MGNRILDALISTPPSLKWFLGGTTLAILWSLTSLPGIIEPAEWTGESWRPGFLLVLYALQLLPLLVVPWLFLTGASLAWEEKKEDGMRAKISRWLNLFGIAACIGVTATLVMWGLWPPWPPA